MKPHFKFLPGFRAMYYEGRVIISVRGGNHPNPLQWAKKMQRLFTEWGTIHGS